MLVAAGNIGACQETLKSGASDTLTPNHTFNAIADDAIPTGPLTFRADVITHNRIVLESDGTVSSSNRATGGHAGFARVL